MDIIRGLFLLRLFLIFVLYFVILSIVFLWEALPIQVNYLFLFVVTYLEIYKVLFCLCISATSICDSSLCHKIMKTKEYFKKCSGNQNTSLLHLRFSFVAYHLHSIFVITYINFEFLSNSKCFKESDLIPHIFCLE